MTVAREHTGKYHTSQPGDALLQRTEQRGTGRQLGLFEAPVIITNIHVHDIILPRIENQLTILNCASIDA